MREEQAEQQELPAWLESLRAHERPVANGSGGQPFTMAELVDENAMPNWMHQDQSRLIEAGASDAFPVLPPTSSPGESSETFPGSGLEASSLIDKQSLPAWMSGTQEGVQPKAGQNVSANSLVQPEALPAWMKNLAQEVRPQASTQPAEGQYGLPASTSFPTQPVVEQYGLPAPLTPPPTGAAHMPLTPPLPTPSYSDPAAMSTQGFSAQELVDQQALPDWMKGAQGGGQQTPGRSVPTGTGFAAGELIDQRALPRWMQDLQGPEKSEPVSALGMPVSGSGQGAGMGQGTQGGVGMPASTLLDMNAMPTWMSEGEQRGASANSVQGAPENMSAGSLIDMGTLPAWLKNSDNAQQSAGGRGAQARAEGMRVPSRPRGEVGPQEQSEAAANVFASMLGVSASTPMPAGGQPQANNLGVAPPRPPQQVQPGLPGWQSPQQAPVNQAAQPWQSPNQSPPENRPPLSPMPGSYVAGSQVGGMQGQTYPGTMGNPNMARGPVASGVGGRAGEAEGTRKKGLFDAIRDFFFH